MSGHHPWPPPSKFVSITPAQYVLNRRLQRIEAYLIALNIGLYGTLGVMVILLRKIGML